MHDFLIAKEILDAVLAEARKRGLKRVTSVELELGSIEEHGQTIKPANLRYNFRLLAKGTPAVRATVKITPGAGASYRITAIEGSR